jgi:Zn-dependent oligopeptidase
MRDAMAVPKGDPARLSANQIATILREEGHDIHHKSVEVHRKGACRCEPGRAPDA